MILECPACHNRYLVDRRAIGAEGRVVRCARCKHEWKAIPQQEDGAVSVDTPLSPLAEPQETQPVPPGSALPVVTVPQEKERPWGLISLLAASFLLFTASAGVYFRPLIVQAAPPLASVYNLLGVYDTQGVVMAELAYYKETAGLKDRHLIRGYIVNTTQEPRRLPVLNIALFGKENVALRRRKLSEASMLQPGESKEFEQALETSPDSAERMVVELGNPLELKLR